MKKSVLLFISLFPLSVLATPASSSDLDSSLIKLVYIDSPSIKAKLPKGAVYTEIKSNLLSLNIPKGLSVDAYPSKNLVGDAVNYTPGKYNDLINIQSIEVTEEFLEKPFLIVKFNEGQKVDDTLCVDIKYTNMGSREDLGQPEVTEICSGQNTTVFKLLPEGLRDGDEFALEFSKGRYSYGVAFIDYSDADGTDLSLFAEENGATGDMRKNGELTFNLRRLKY